MLAMPSITLKYHHTRSTMAKEMVDRVALVLIDVLTFSFSPLCCLALRGSDYED